MGPGAWLMVVALVLAFVALAVVVFSLVRSIMNERTGNRSVCGSSGWDWR